MGIDWSLKNWLSQAKSQQLIARVMSDEGGGLSTEAEGRGMMIVITSPFIAVTLTQLFSHHHCLSPSFYATKSSCPYIYTPPHPHPSPLFTALTTSLFCIAIELWCVGGGRWGTRRKVLCSASDLFGNNRQVGRGLVRKR